jgi:anhydro-N-acetylmuramic acid kinase
MKQTYTDSTTFKPLTILGLMSGTSVDGLDLALCDFWKDNQKFCYQIMKAETYPYPEELHRMLKDIFESSAHQFCHTEVEFSNFMAKCVNHFLDKIEKKPHYISSHGHTVFHQPEQGLTKQAGNGAILAAKTGISTVCDFRTTDVALGGQGAPLVPIGDMLLFPEYDGCLNLGGIANISRKKQEKCTAYDISLCNIPLNFLANQCGFPYDKDGNLAQKGKISFELLEALNKPAYFSLNRAKSIGFELFDQYYRSLLECKETRISTADKLRTICEHIAMQVVANLSDLQKILVTGGGAKNKFLIDLMKEKTDMKIVIPEEQLIDFKEALLFAFLGYLRVHETNNCLSSVTGALSDSCGGAIYLA